jgi:hypothetical protein
MATQDLSRHLLQPEKRYSSARMQQGRVILDSDVNEAELLDDEGQRLIVKDVVGPHGSSTPGFAIGEVLSDVYDFEILSGSYFLGGLRHEIADVEGQPQRFLAQTDWLQSSRSNVTLPELPEEARHDLVYLVGWEQTVSAVEDLELVEHALGGRDTTVRVRRMSRVRVLPGSAADCSVAFTDGLVGTLITGGHAFDTNNNELRSAARLTVSLAAVVPSDDLCNPPGTLGYSATENQAIRVQLITPDRFLWAYDNASPLYRVLVTHTEGTATIEFLTPPQEQGMFPLTGQVVEILPWGAVLANGEHIADHPIAPGVGGGVYGRVLATYNPVTKTLTANITDTTTFDAMLAWFDGPPVIPVEQRCFFLRVWNGDEAPEEGYGYSIAASVALPGTGLSVAFNQAGIVGDYWILAARPATPALVVPWDLLSGAAPHGPRRFYCPLGMLDWTFDEEEELQVAVDSCRRPFRPLTHLRGCSSVTVGDGVTSFGDYDSIQAALDALHRGVPGKVCILPGVYEERISLANRFKIVIEGCGPRTIVRTPPGNDTSQGLISLVYCTDITFRNFSVEAIGQCGITMRSQLATETTWCQRITLEKLAITTRRDPTLPAPTLAELAVPVGSAPFPLCTVVALGASEVRLLDSTFTEVGDLSAAANVLFALCKRVTVRGCKIVSPPGDGTISKAWGGLHIAGGCSDILIERNLIDGGLGHGITLGSAHLEGSTVDPAEPYDPGSHFTIAPLDDCPSVVTGFAFETTLTGRGHEPSLIPDDGPHDLRIRRNRIRAMGGSGISVLGFWPEVSVRTLVEQIQTHDLDIDDNIIEGNCTHPPEGSLPPALREVAAFGGIVLANADALRIHDNLIRSNGADHRHPVCGVYVLHGENITVENNQIQDNGRRVPGTGLAGHRAGIALQLVGRKLFASDTAGAPDLSQPAARVRGNTVLQPAGRALQIHGTGPIFVEGNVLVSEGLAGLNSDQMLYAAHCVEIQNLGQSSDLIQEGIIPAAIALFPSPPLLLDDVDINPEFIDGRVLFTDNVVRFNPVPGAADDIFCINRVQSYGDVAVLNNQFFARLPAAEGYILQDTVVTAWSTRTSHNRWEDPTYPLVIGGPSVTTVSATTLACMNITTLNQASRCIHATSPPLPAIATPIATNQIYSASGCDPDPGLETLLAAP